MPDILIDCDLEIDHEKHKVIFTVEWEQERNEKEKEKDKNKNLEIKTGTDTDPNSDPNFSLPFIPLSS